MLSDLHPHGLTIFWLRGLDFTPAHDEDVADDAPIIVAAHGLTGGLQIVGDCRCIMLSKTLGSHESYVRAILAPAVTPKSEGGLGFRGVVVNFRGCKGIPVTLPIANFSYIS